VTADLFDAGSMYDDDYLYFFAPADGRSEFAAHGPTVPGTQLPGAAAADLANQLAARGGQITGLDSSAVFLDRARADAAAAGVSIEYVAGDMREIGRAGQFDRIVNWSTAFGYFDDDTNRAVLDGIARALRPGGRLAMDLDNLTRFLASYTPSRVVAAKDNGDMLVDRYHLDALTSRFEAERTVIRGGRSRPLNFVKRLFGYPELRDWLLAAGFRTVNGYGEDGQPLTSQHQRMIMVASR
jgi:SAM-dependent methyltransferase